jgi:Asp-tRNA(Asn)/Glu-tRNA(Gln) amidotransferase A subunit family amidase
VSRQTFARLTSQVRCGQADPRDVTAAALTAAAAAGGVFWEVGADRARADAESLWARVRDRAAASAPRSRTAARVTPGLPLCGVPVAVKDAFAVGGLVRHLGLSSAAPVSEGDAAAVAVLRAAGAVVIGTTAMDQLAWTMTGQAPGYPRCENPLVPGHSPGGSSGGAAAAVAAGVVPLALGSDSAGSVRVPGAWCGLVAFKPTFGTIDLDGCAPLAPPLDTAGILARGVDDCRLAFGALSSGGPAAPPAGGGSPRLGVPDGMIAATECEPALLSAWERTLVRLSGAGLELCSVDLSLEVRGVGAIFAANLAARWGNRVDAEPPDLVHPDVRAGVAFGRSLAATDYVRASAALAGARRLAPSLFGDVDVLVLPTAPILPPPLERPAPVAVASAFTRPWSAFGCPAISLPCAAREVSGCGVQIVARPGEDGRLLTWASELEDLIAG